MMNRQTPGLNPYPVGTTNSPEKNSPPTQPRELNHKRRRAVKAMQCVTGGLKIKVVRSCGSTWILSCVCALFLSPSTAPLPSSNPYMLWAYKLNFTGYLDSSADIAEARKALAEKMKTDPYAFIGSLTPVEPSCKTVGDLVKRVFTGG